MSPTGPRSGRRLKTGSAARGPARRPSKPSPRTLAGLLLAAGVLIQILLDPVSSARHAWTISAARTGLPAARARWEALGVDDYTFEIRGDARSICRPSAIIQVRGGAVVGVETMGSAPAGSAAVPLPPARWIDPDWGEEVFLCNYARFTMPQIFDLLEETLDFLTDSIMHVEFDPQFGFVTDFRSGIYVGYGLLRPRLDNCCDEFQIRNFQVLEE